MHELRIESDIRAFFSLIFHRTFRFSSMVVHDFFFFFLQLHVSDFFVKMKGEKNRKFVKFNALIVS